MKAQISRTWEETVLAGGASQRDVDGDSIRVRLSRIFALDGSGGQRRDRTADAGLFRAALYH